MASVTALITWLIANGDWIVPSVTTLIGSVAAVVKHFKAKQYREAAEAAAGAAQDATALIDELSERASQSEAGLASVVAAVEVAAVDEESAKIVKSTIKSVATANGVEGSVVAPVVAKITAIAKEQTQHTIARSGRLQTAADAAQIYKARREAKRAAAK